MKEQVFWKKFTEWSHARILPHICAAAYGLACFYLYYRQSTADLTAEVIRYQSDLPLHISMVVEDGWMYSFTAIAYLVLYRIFQGPLGIAMLLAVCTVGTVYAAEKLVIQLSGWKKGAGTLFLALSLNFVMPAYVPFIGEFRYVSYQSPNIWHNSTYICMRLAALLTLSMYFSLEKTYREGLTAKQWLGFALLNILTTGIKPSFLLAFSPVMGICLLWDLLTDRKLPFYRILLFGSALLPSGLVILWQNSVLFGEETGNGIAFDPWYTFSLHANIPKLAVVCSALFCGLAILCTLKNVFAPGTKRYRFLIAMAALSFLEALCLVEKGSRSVDGNFLWGYSFCLFTLFAVTAVKAVSLPELAPARWKKTAGLLRAGLFLAYGYHLYCGMYYFFKLLGGESFWM